MKPRRSFVALLISYVTIGPGSFEAHWPITQQPPSPSPLDNLLVTDSLVVTDQCTANLVSCALSALNGKYYLAVTALSTALSESTALSTSSSRSSVGGPPLAVT